MDAAKRPCQATTQAGEPCKRTAQPGSDYCAIHQRMAEQGKLPATPATTAAQSIAETTRTAQAALQPEPSTPRRAGQAAGRTSEANIDLLLEELDTLSQELQRRLNSATAITPAQLLAMINNSVGRYAPEMPREVLRDLERNLEGTTFQDLVDPETLKGLWYILSYSAQGSSQATFEKVRRQLAALPSYGALADLTGSLEGTSPRDLVDPKTWIGFVTLLAGTAQQQVAGATRRVLGKKGDKPSTPPAA
jgi:hypothetical protein